MTRYLKEFDDCFGRVTTRRHLDTYVEGQLSDLERKRAQAISRRLLVTQQPSCSATELLGNATPAPPSGLAAHSHRRRTLRRLHEIGVFLKDAIICQPRRL